VATSVSIIVPLFNELPGIPALEQRLVPFVRRWGEQREVELLLVDDGSRDGTGPALLSLARPPAVQVVTHEVNQGLTAALWTGILRARGEIVCFLDSDLTYDPEILPELVALVEAGADVALASPYHPQGGVEGVPARRLVLSRGLSRLYRWFVHADLWTFTGMVRAWRRELLLSCRPERGGFLGIAEMLLRALDRGARVAELPAVLRARKQGASKLHVVPTVLGHLDLLVRKTLGW
jgi:dolichol-phosphate mannosyltransferase